MTGTPSLRNPNGTFVGGTQRPECRIDVGERFWAKIEKGGEDECWNWTAGCDSSGYGTFALWESGERHTISAHRMAYSLEIGAIPAGLQVCHHCDNRKCCNPKHFFIGTNDDNHRDKMEKGRQARGETAGLVNLTEADVRFLRDAVRSGNGISRLAKQTGIPHCTVHSAVRGKTWKHVDGAVVLPTMDMVGQTKSVTIRELRDATTSLIGLAARGMQITITSDGMPIAVISLPQN